MKKLLIVLSILISTTAFAQNGEKNFIDQNFVEVIGKAELNIVPDQIYLKIYINEKDNKKRISISEVEKSMISKLNELGVDIDKELFIKDLSSNFKYYWLSKSNIILTKEYQVLVHDATTAGKVFIEFEKLGISNISIEKLDHSKIREYRKEVKINAIKAAKEKASSLAVAIDQKIGRALFVKEIDANNNYLSNTLSNRASTMKIRGVSKIKDVEFEKINIKYSILCRFELK